jgi:hypothetical protein
MSSVLFIISRGLFALQLFSSSRVKVLNGANAGLMVVIMCKLGKQSESVQMAILKRYTEIA